jgi:hypothetical protein
LYERNCVPISVDYCLTKPRDQTASPTGCSSWEETEEQDEVVCAKDVKAGRITDRFLAPAISRFATDVWSMSKQTAGVRRKVEGLHQRWGKTNAISNSENFKAQADNEAKWQRNSSGSFNGKISNGKRIP